MPSFELKNSEYGDILKYLEALDSRIARIEKYLGLRPDFEAGPAARVSQPARAPVAAGETAESSFEFRIGTFGLTWVGGMALLLGILFLVSYTYGHGQALLSALLGYGIAFLLLAATRKWEQSYPHFSFMLRVIAYLLLFYVTLRLHFFTQQPLVGSWALAILLLLVLVGAQLFRAYRHPSEFFAFLALLQGMATALLCDSPPYCFALLLVFAGLATYFFIRRNWMRLYLGVIFLTYFAHLIWLLNNPVLGHPIRAASEPHNSLVFLFAYEFIFSLPLSWYKTSVANENAMIAGTILNGSGFVVLSLLATLTFYQQNYPLIYLIIGVFFMSLAIFQFITSQHPFVPALNACFGFMALTVAIYGYSKIPDAYFWLALQSLLVVSMALWFRSKIIVVLNTFIFVCILLAYHLTGSTFHLANFSFALVALGTARVLNWKKDRLTLKTDHLRNLYLVVAFFMVLYSLYKAVPGQWVTLSWTGAAIVYFLVSLLLHNIKYRWMAILTMLVTALYLVVIDLSRLEAIYRIIAFLFLGLIALIVSVFYNKIRQQVQKIQK